MAELTRAEVKTVVRKALKLVADFQGTFEHFTFNRFQKYHKMVFLEGVKNGINTIRPVEDRYYDIELTQDSIKKWKTIGDCIDWVLAKRRLRRGKSSVLSKNDLES